MRHANPPERDVMRLETLHAQLAAALEARDWARLATVSEAIRSTLLELAQCPDLGTPVMLARTRLGRLHREAVEACADECERLRGLLEQHLENGEGRAAYAQIDDIGERTA